MSFNETPSVFVEQSNTIRTFVADFSILITGKCGKCYISSGIASSIPTFCKYPFSTYDSIVCSAKSPFIILSVRQNVRSTKCPSAKCPFGKMSFGKVSFGKMSGYRAGIPCTLPLCFFNSFQCWQAVSVHVLYCLEA